jgi:hypothetical protein
MTAPDVHETPASDPRHLRASVHLPRNFLGLPEAKRDDWIMALLGQVSRDASVRSESAAAMGRLSSEPST